jgi:hypothetical protein
MSLDDVYAVRSQLGRLRQPEHQALVEHCHAACSVTNSFDDNQRSRLHPKVKSCMASPRFMATCDAEYFYRLHSALGIVRNTEINLDSMNPDQFFPQLRRKAKSSGTWVRLSEYADGEYRSPRNFTFWTDSEYDENESIIARAYRCGLVITKIPHDAVLLRCPVKEIPNYYVPTVVDACDYPVFDPLCLDVRTGSGNAIDINDLSDLKHGSKEYVLPAIPTALIDMLPIPIDSFTFRTHVHVSESSILESLRSYYNDATTSGCRDCLSRFRTGTR